MSRKQTPAVVAALLSLAASASVATADPQDFYRGRTVEVLVGFSPGGGYDTYARALSRSLGAQIPGTPQVVVKNMTGAGSLRLARFLQDAAPRVAGRRTARRIVIWHDRQGLLTASMIKASNSTHPS